MTIYLLPWTRDVGYEFAQICYRRAISPSHNNIWSRAGFCHCMIVFCEDKWCCSHVYTTHDTVEEAMKAIDKFMSSNGRMFLSEDRAQKIGVLL